MSKKVLDRFLSIKEKVNLLQDRLDQSRQGNDLYTNLLLDLLEKDLTYFSYFKLEDFVTSKEIKPYAKIQSLKYQLQQALDGVNIPRLTASIIADQREEIERLQQKVYELNKNGTNNRTAVCYKSF